MAEGDTIVEVDSKMTSPQNILRVLIGDDLEGSVCKIKLIKAGSVGGEPMEVLIRRARADVVHEQVCRLSDFLSC